MNIHDKNIDRYGPDQVLRGVKRMGGFLKGRRLGRSGESAASQSAGELRQKRLLEELNCEMEDMGPVSYTHLDVYKRQTSGRPWALSAACW